MNQHSAFRSSLAALFSLCFTALVAQSQPQGTNIFGNVGPNFIPDSLIIFDGSDTAPCSTLLAIVISHNTAPGIGYPSPELNTYFSLKRGPGIKQVHARFTYRSSVSIPGIQYGLTMDGAPMSGSDGNVTVTQHNLQSNAPFNYQYEDNLTISYSAGDLQDTAVFTHEFGLSPLIIPYDIRFRAVLVGSTVTQPIGTFTTPSLPRFILRDPPGDQSYSSITTTDHICRGYGMSMSSSESSTGWVNAQIGVEGDVGWIVETSFAVWASGQSSSTTSSSNDVGTEINECITTTNSFSTSGDGAPEDIFMGSSVRYSYGAGIDISRPSCDSIKKSYHLVVAPYQVISSYTKTESAIRGEVIPGLVAQINSLDPVADSTLYRSTVAELEAWQNALALNDSIKTNADESGTITAFQGGGSGTEVGYITSSSKMRSVEFTASLDNGLSGEFGAAIAGSSISAGGEMTFRSEYGTSETSGSETENETTYLLEDSNGDDHFTMRIVPDSVFGTFVFILDSVNSTTSCPYEGGYQLDQPSLFVESMGNSEMTLNDVPSGTQAIFPLLICNNSNVQRDYSLKFENATNTEGGILHALGNPVNSTDNGQVVSVPAGGCLSLANLSLTQPSLNVLDFDSIIIDLFSPCETEIKSSVSISAHFTPSTGIAAASASNGAFTVRPNPSAGRFDLVTADATSGPITVTMHDGLGRVVLPQVSFTGQRIMPIDMEGVAPGTYYLTATSADQQHVLRVMVEH